MKTTKNISLGGYAFIIEEDAYILLKNYTDAVRAGFSNVEGGDEIQHDIEFRIAEIFKEKLIHREVLTKTDIEEMIGIMGEPSIYSSEGNSAQMPENNIEKRFFRDPDKRVFGGVSSGIAAYFNIDPVWIRLVFLIAILGFGTGLGVYIILWIAIPEAKTTSDKLSMHGKSPNLSNITDSIKNTKNLQKTGNNIVGILTETLRKLVDLTIAILKTSLKVILICMGIMFGLFLLSMFIFLLNQDNLEVSPLIGWSQIKSFLFLNNSVANLGYLALLMLFLIPLLYLFYRVILYFLKEKQVNKYVSLTALLTWLLSFSIVIYTGFNLGMQYRHSGQSIQTISFPSDTSHTFFMTSVETDSVFEHVLNDGSLRIKNVQVDIIKGGMDSLIKLKIIRKQNGPSKAEATEGAKLIQFATSFENGKLLIPNFLTIPPKQKYRNQEVEIELTIPYGQNIKIDSSLERLLNDVELDGKIYMDDMYNYTLKMTPLGLQCIDCPKEIFDKVQRDNQIEHPEFIPSDTTIEH